MIILKEIEKQFGPVKALRGVNIQIEPGKVTGIVGPNGCGKTTLIRTLLGLVVPDRGDILINGATVRGKWEYRNRIGYMPQNPDFPANLTVRELLDLMEDVRSEKGVLREELIQNFGLTSSLSRPFSTLSGGTKQKTAAVAAFMFDSDIMVLDEPTVGLDPVAASTLKTVATAAANRGRSVILVSHIMNEMQQVANDVVFMLDGQVSFSGDLKSILNRMNAETLEQAVVQWMKKDQ